MYIFHYIYIVYEKKNKTRITNTMGSMGSINGESS